jgi:hypothetical protein
MQKFFRKIYVNSLEKCMRILYKKICEFSRKIQIVRFLILQLIFEILSEVHVLQINNQNKVHVVSQQLTAVK